MSSLVKHAERELAILRGQDREPDEMQDAMEEHILKMVQVFADEGHSGYSASYALSVLKKVMNFEPITPLTGDDSEWVEVGEQNGKPLYQNNRCSRVFREGDAHAYDINGKVFRDPDGSCFTSRDSHVSVTFPYTPTSVIVDRATN